MTAERRRSPRIRPPEGAGGIIRSTVQVRVEDISLTGVRFRLSGPVRPGSTYAFHAQLHGLDLVAPIRITRCAVGPAVEGTGGGLVYFAGAEFQWESASDERRLASWLESRGPDPGQIDGALRG